MKAKCCVEGSRSVKKVKDDTKCAICKKSLFRVNRITPELIMLTCENCGETHMIGADSNEGGMHLMFWSSETVEND
jgi:hypothetical protein